MTTVILIKSIPAQLHNPVMCSGIQTKERAKAWAERQGATVVYFYRRMERCYCEKKVTK